MTSAALPLMTPPVLKAGAVIYRTLRPGTPEETREFLVIQPPPTRGIPGDLPPQGLVRGTRQYQAEQNGPWLDADHDGITQPETVYQFESVYKTMTRESEEEVGLPPAVLLTRDAKVHNVGMLPFRSDKPTTPAKPIHWYAIELDAEGQKYIEAHNETCRLKNAKTPGYPTEFTSQWMPYEALERLVEEKKASSGYLQVIEETERLLDERSKPRASSRPGRTRPEMAVPSR